MNLIISGKNETVNLTQNTISELLKVKKVEMPEMVSVELNGEILRQSEYDSTIIKDGDEIEFLYFMGGGR
jgi:sulfur carrier protein